MQAGDDGAAVQDVEGDGPRDNQVQDGRHGQDVGQEEPDGLNIKT